jgi:hypothetical protein
MMLSLRLSRHFQWVLWLGLAFWLASGGAALAADSPQPCVRTISADVVALDQELTLNRLGAVMAGGMIFALADDVISSDPTDKSGKLQAGKVKLRAGKRPRPLVLRMNVGDCLRIKFTNLLSPTKGNGAATRYAGLHINGVDLVPSAPGGEGIASDGSWVGLNQGTSGSLLPPKPVTAPNPPVPPDDCAPGQSICYTCYAKAEGTFLFYGPDNSGAINPKQLSLGLNSQVSQGLFGALNVQPEWAEWYRSQVTRDDLDDATLRLPDEYNTTIPRQRPANAVPEALGGPPAPPTRSKPVNNRLLQLLPPVPPPPQPGVALERLGASNTVQIGRRVLKKFTLLSVIPDKHAELTTDVLQDDQGRLYSPAGHPLIDYNSVYRADQARPEVPVLKMLQTLKADKPLFTTKLTPEQVELAIRGLVSENNYITLELRQQFATMGGTKPDGQGIELSDGVQITDAEGRDAWLLTDPYRKLYFVERLSNPAQFEVSYATLKIVHSDLTAIITGPRAGRFGYWQESPSFATNPTLPDRRQPYREFTILYHFVPNTSPAFPQAYTAATNQTFTAGLDQYAINYGTAAIGPEVIANRIGVGPMGNADAVDLKFEEFFLSSWAVGDPSMIVDVLANDQAKANVRRAPVKPVATIDQSPNVVADLDAGKVDDALRENFKAAGVNLSVGAIASPVCEGKEWVVLDPGTGNTVATPSRGRYPIVAATVDRAGKPVKILKVYPGPLAAAPAVAGAATKALYPDDPSNVYHSNIRDHVKFRILHAGPGPSHVHHLHAHQWLHSPNSTESQYLDSQLIIPGSAYTLEMVYNGSGNRNMTVGDSIFHCHFYPHFAKGMWSLWRVHDVFEGGTRLDKDGRPVQFVDEEDNPVYRTTKDGVTQFVAYGKANDPRTIAPEKVKRAFNRALPDGEIEVGTPIPAIVPLPSLAEPPVPPNVRLTDLAPFYPEGEGQGRRVYVEPSNLAEIKKAKDDGKTMAPVYDNPGYPFFIPGIAGHRAPHPPMDFAWREDANGKPIYKDGNKVYLNGGLPRHVALGGEIVEEYQTRWDFTREFIAYDHNDKTKPVAGKLSALELPDLGTPVEKGAMAAHSHRTIASFLPNGDPGNVTRNGIKGLPGAPYAPPMADDYGNADYNTRRYQAAVIQTDVVQNKLGWHFPQQRFLNLWEDVAHTIAGERAPQPLFFRSNTNDSITFWHTNLVPSYYELDDFQIRTPTDVIGQHIHNVKFDVTSSDGGANGFNYEDGTFSPDEVRGRIDAIMRPGGPEGFAPGILRFDDATGFVDKCAPPYPLAVVKVKDAYPARNGVGNDHGLFGTPPDGQNWDGAQTTVQLWDCDPLLSNSGNERTLRTIFTHDHLGPSTHQQAGLYAGLLVEPQGSLWYLPSGEKMNSRLDGGPTNWEGYIVPADPKKSYREFALEFQDTQLAYKNTSIIKASKDLFTPKGNPTTGPAAFDIAAGPPSTNSTKVAAYMTALDAGQLPPEGFLQAFVGNGIPLSPQATVTVVTPQKMWRIQQPNGPGIVNAGQSYTVWATNVSAVPGVTPAVLVTRSLFVATPDISPGWADPPNALNPPPPDAFGVGLVPLGAPVPQLVSDGNTGVYSMNYRSESVLARVGPPPTGDQLTKKIDLAYVFNSLTDRNIQLLDEQPTPGDPINPAQPKGFKYPPSVAPLPGPAGTTKVPGVNEPGDPFTPLMRAYAGDRVQVRTLVGAHVLAHSFQIQGVRWDFEPDDPGSGPKNAQAMGISEHFEMHFTLPAVAAHHDNGLPPFADYLVAPSSSLSGLANGDWTLMRGFGTESGTDGSSSYLHPLPNNPLKEVEAKRKRMTAKIKEITSKFDQLKTRATDPNANGKDLVDGNLRFISVVATTVAQALPEKALNFNPRFTNPDKSPTQFQLNNILLFVRAADLDKNGQLKPDAPREPLILRAKAGEWIMVNLKNSLPSENKTPADPAFPKAFLLNNTNYPGSLNPQVFTSRRAGLHPALVSFDITDSNGINLGFNPESTVAPGESRTFLWYAGDLEDKFGKLLEKPVEFGAINLVPADLMVQPQFGMVGALVIEPEGSDWVEDVGTHASALVTAPSEHPFREFVLVGQNAIANILANNGKGVWAWGAFNFRTEPFTTRQPLPEPGTLGYAKAFSNKQINEADPTKGDPVTPIFRAAAGTPVRFRFVMPSTTTSAPTPFVFDIHGHGWQEEPFSDNGAKIAHNPRSQYFGAQQVLPYEAFNFVLDKAGGHFNVPGDYLYETYQQTAQTGTWGLFRVEPGLVTVTKLEQNGRQLTLSGRYQPSRANAGKPGKISVSIGAGPAIDATLDPATQSWTFTTTRDPKEPPSSTTTSYTISSSLGGSTTIDLPLKVAP